MAALVAVASTVYAGKLQTVTGPISADKVSALQTLLVTIGGSLVGATAIVSTMMFYALQINVERMPHNLFRKLSFDGWLTCAFIGTFLLALVVAGLSMFVGSEVYVVPLIGAFWVCVSTLALFGFAYRRTLDLVSPNYQLKVVTSAAKKDLAKWQTVAQRVSNRVAKAEPPVVKNSDVNTTDYARLQLFQQFPGWTRGVDVSLFYALNFASRYAGRNDFSVVQAAHASVLEIHEAYIGVKGKTFIAANALIDSPLTGDAVLSNTLETLRQSHREAVAQGNERYVVENLNVLARLAELYLFVEYGAKYSRSKTHSNLAAHYLADSIKEIIPHNRPDVLLEGARLLGKHALLCIAHDNRDEVSTIAQRLSEIAVAGIARGDHLPVTIVAVEQLGKATQALLVSQGSDDFRFVLQDIGKRVQEIALLALQHIKDSPLNSRHSQAMSGYYSATDTNALPAVLVALGNELVGIDAEHEGAKNISRHIAQWSDQLFLKQKELLLASIAAKSHFTFDLLHWIFQTTKVLALVSKSKNCPEHTAASLVKDANWLISVLSWIPDDMASVHHIEVFQISDQLFDCAMWMHKSGHDDIACTCAKLLLSWALHAGQYQTGWGSLEKGMSGVAVLSLIPELQPEVSTKKVSEHLAKIPIDQSLLDRAARELRARAENPSDGSYHSEIERGLAAKASFELERRLKEFAEIMSPNSAD